MEISQNLTAEMMFTSYSCFIVYHYGHRIFGEVLTLNPNEQVMSLILCLIELMLCLIYLSFYFVSKKLMSLLIFIFISTHLQYMMSTFITGSWYMYTTHLILFISPFSKHMFHLGVEKYLVAMNTIGSLIQKTVKVD